jgi:hypothetical protein
VHKNTITFASETKNNITIKRKMKKIIVAFVMILQVAVSLDLLTADFAKDNESNDAEIAASSCNTNNYIEVSDMNELETYMFTE